MSLSLGLTVLLSVQAAAPAETWVVLARTSGVTTTRSLELARAVAAQLNEDGVPSHTAVEDLSTCASKKPCLVDFGRKQKVQAMVLLEVGTVLDDAFVRAEAISVEADGKSMGVTDAESEFSGLEAALKLKISTVLVARLKKALGLGAPPPPVAAVAPSPVVDVPKAAPTSAVLTPVDQPKRSPPEVVTAPAGPAQPFFTPRRIVGVALVGLGAVALAFSTVMWVQTRNRVSEQASLCPSSPVMTCPRYDEALVAHSVAVSAQNLALASLGVGGALAIGGSVLLALPTSPASPTRVSFTPLPGGGAAVLSGSF